MVALQSYTVDRRDLPDFGSRIQRSRKIRFAGPLCGPGRTERFLLLTNGLWWGGRGVVGGWRNGIIIISLINTAKWIVCIALNGAARRRSRWPGGATAGRDGKRRLTTITTITTITAVRRFTPEVVRRARH